MVAKVFKIIQGSITTTRCVVFVSPLWTILRFSQNARHHTGWTIFENHKLPNVMIPGLVMLCCLQRFSVTLQLCGLFVCENNLTTAHLFDLPLRTMIGSNKSCFFELWTQTNQFRICHHSWFTCLRHLCSKHVDNYKSIGCWICPTS